MSSYEKQAKHLEMIQGVISRLAQNSFFIKGWSVTLVVAVLALSDKEVNSGFAWIAPVPVVIFWFLDGYFLRQERLFRELYKSVAKDVRDGTCIVPFFSMDTSVYKGAISGFFATTFWGTVLAFHLAVLGATAIGMVVVLKVL